jgi:hypothetical protein
MDTIWPCGDQLGHHRPVGVGIAEVRDVVHFLVPDRCHLLGQWLAMIHHDRTNPLPNLGLGREAVAMTTSPARFAS